jgi:translation initiation factor IF-1
VKENAVEFNGVVVECLRDAFFRVQIDGHNGHHHVMARLSNRMDQHHIKIVVGDKVKIELTPYDLSRGRITYRL